MKLEVWVAGAYDPDTKKRVSWRYVIGTKSALGTAMEIARVECRNKEEKAATRERDMAQEICKRWNQIEEKDVISQEKQTPKIILPIVMAFFLLISGGHCEAKENKNITTGTASWYSSKDACGPKTNNHKGCPTASGISIYKLEREKTLFCAVPKGTYKMGSRLKITNSGTGKSIIVTVLDRGGFKKYGRAIDLGKKSFSKIAPLGQGTIQVKIEVIK